MHYVELRAALYVPYVQHHIKPIALNFGWSGRAAPTCLLLAELSLNLLVVAGVVDDGPRQLGLDVSQPRAQAAHVLVQLLHGHQGLPQLLHPGGGEENTIELILIVNNTN